MAGPIEVAADLGGGILEENSHKRIKTELVSAETAD